MDDVLLEYAGYLVPEEQKEMLADIFRYIEKLTPLEDPGFPLPEPPAEYLAKIGQRLELIGK